VLAALFVPVALIGVIVGLLAAQPAPDSNGSVFGLTTLVGDGQAKQSAGVIAMSDGPAPAESAYRPLNGKPIAMLNGLSPDYGDIGRSVNEYAFWTVEYLYTYGPATGLAEAFLKYLGTPTALSDLQAADYTLCPADGRGRAGTLCTEAGS
jgi:hypothetical protein